MPLECALSLADYRHPGPGTTARGAPASRPSHGTPKVRSTTRASTSSATSEGSRRPDTGSDGGPGLLEAHDAVGLHRLPQGVVVFWIPCEITDAQLTKKRPLSSRMTNIGMIEATKAPQNPKKPILKAWPADSQIRTDPGVG